TVQPTVFMTTRGRRDYTVFFDAPSRPTQPWRITGFFGREQQLAAPYYGVGNETPYDPAIDRGATRYFYRYGSDRVLGNVDLQHVALSPAFRVLGGAGLSRDAIDLTPFDSGRTLIESDLASPPVHAGHTNFI